MSSKNSIFLTKDNEHCYLDCDEPRFNERGDFVGDDIIMESNKNNIEILRNDDDDLIIKIKAGTEIHRTIKLLD